MFEIRLNDKLIRRYHDRKKAELNFTICKDLIYKGYNITIHFIKDKPTKKAENHCAICGEYASNTDIYCSHCGQKI